MAITDKSDRRTFLGTLSAFSAALLSPRKLFASPAARMPAPGKKLTGFGSTGNVYEEWGVTTVINGQGTMTVLGGSLPRPEVEAVMAAAGRPFLGRPEPEVASGRGIG